MIINNNIQALNTYRQLGTAASAGAKSMERLSSGLRINKAADDAAGLAISEKMRAQIRGLDQAQRNAQDGVSMIQTAEGAMDTQHSILQRMRELSVQASNSTLTDADKQNIQEEMNQLIDEVDRIANTTEFNNTKLLNGQVSEQSKFATSSGGDVSTVVANANAATGTSEITLSSTKTTVATGSIFSTGGLQVDNGTGGAPITDGSAKLTNLLDSSSNSLGLEVGDEITISGVVGGEVKNSTFIVTKDSTLDDFMASVQNTLGAKDVFVSDANVYDNNAVGLDTGSVNLGSIVVEGEAGAAFDISSLKITAKSELGTDKTAFNSSFTGDGISVNGGLLQNQVATNVGDYVATVDMGSDGNSAGDAAIAVRANATINVSNLEVTFDDALIADSSSTIKIGARDQSAQIQIGANEGQHLKISIDATTADALGLRKDGVNLSVMTEKSASEAITKINDAINTVSSQRSKLGAMQNRLEYTTTSLASTAENMTAAESRIRDVDMAKEMMEFTKNNILSQAAQSMLAQANQQPQQVLQLLR
ncbi:flagellin [Bacillus sp. FJAT-27251]|uniref:flagellin N-terminal helical domain-containing protein n=1 Tax=Bacillus sp. FJAT-27251 TaxID=1684142 RepID=UPI0006A7B821|nr:flagellin [Bacillus sp. FJAT-27251]